MIGYIYTQIDGDESIIIEGFVLVIYQEFQKLVLIADILNKDYTKQNPKRIPVNPTITSAVSGVRPGMKN